MAGTSKARPKSEARAAQPPKVRRKTVSPYATKEWKAARAQQLKEHPNCQVCGAKWRKGMPVHHLDGVKNNPTHEADGLYTLCPSCHQILEIVFRRRGNLKYKAFVQLWKLAQRKLAPVATSRNR